MWQLFESEVEESCYWLSFCDPKAPTGQQFLGACLIKAAASDPKAAIETAWALGVNPGGEVQFVEATREQTLAITSALAQGMNKLYRTRAEADAFSAELTELLQRHGVARQEPAGA